MAIRPCGCCDLIGIQSIVCPRGVEVVFTISIRARRPSKYSQSSRRFRS